MSLSCPSTTASTHTVLSFSSAPSPHHGLFFQWGRGEAVHFTPSPPLPFLPRAAVLDSCLYPGVPQGSVKFSHKGWGSLLWNLN